MNNQTIEHRRLEDMEGDQLRRPAPWYCSNDALEMLKITLVYCVVVIALPFALNWVFNWLNVVLN